MKIQTRIEVKRVVEEFYKPRIQEKMRSALKKGASEDELLALLEEELKEVSLHITNQLRNDVVAGVCFS